MTPDTAPEAITEADREAADALEDELGFLTVEEMPKVLTAFARHRLLTSHSAGEKLREALRRMVYETTHLSPCKPNGDHECTIKADTLAYARKVLAAISAPDSGERVRPKDDGLAERIRAAVTYVYMPMQVRRLLSEAAKALTPPSDAGSTTRSGGEGEDALVPARCPQCGVGGGGHEHDCPYVPVATLGARSPTTPSPDASPDSGEAMRFYKLPFALHEPEGDGAAYIRDADGGSVAMLMWPGHSLEDTDAAVEETYRIGRAMAAAVNSPSPSPAIVKEAGEVVNVAIWSGEHRAYWRRGSRGEGANYTLNLDEAGIWTRDEATQLTSHCGPEKLIALHDRPALSASNAAQVSK